VIRVGNIVRGVKTTVVCDSPFYYTFPITTTYTYGSPPSSSAILFDNFTQDSGYTFPTIEITMNGTGGTATIVNSTDNTRTFQFTGLAANEVINVDNDLQIITSSLSLLRLANFNKNFFRFLKGRNILSVTGNISQLKFTYQFAKKLGG
jgi:phage-related protein